MKNERLKEILRNAIIAYEFELMGQDYKTLEEEHGVLLNEFDMTQAEYEWVMTVEGEYLAESDDETSQMMREAVRNRLANETGDAE